MVSSGRGVSIVSVEFWLRAGRREYRLVGRSGEGRGRGIWVDGGGRASLGVSWSLDDGRFEASIMDW